MHIFLTFMLIDFLVGTHRHFNEISTTQKLKFVFLNEAYRPTVYTAGARCAIAKKYLSNNPSLRCLIKNRVELSDRTRAHFGMH